ncbi:MAG: hypothetical protein ABIC91_04890 [Nanoarchaeota archaeon]|nr:hypothetical protein [Nanoarchaeota archaeon]MBU1850144.1 hypothetical protein [Nanoarchaeota archaeon]
MDENDFLKGEGLIMEPLKDVSLISVLDDCCRYVYINKNNLLSYQFKDLEEFRECVGYSADPVYKISFEELKDCWMKDSDIDSKCFFTPGTRMNFGLFKHTNFSDKIYDFSATVNDFMKSIEDIRSKEISSISSLFNQIYTTAKTVEANVAAITDFKHLIVPDTFAPVIQWLSSASVVFYRLEPW